MYSVASVALPTHGRLPSMARSLKAQSVVPLSSMLRMSMRLPLLSLFVNLAFEAELVRAKHAGYG